MSRSFQVIRTCGTVCAFVRGKSNFFTFRVAFLLSSITTLFPHFPCSFPTFKYHNLVSCTAAVELYPFVFCAPNNANYAIHFHVPVLRRHGLRGAARKHNILVRKDVVIRKECRGAFEWLGEDPSYRGVNMVLLCPENEEMLLNILHAINLFRSEPGHQFVRIQAKSVLQTVASVIGSWTRRQGKMHFRV